MDLNFHESSNNDNEMLEPGELLEDSWFFGNLLHRKSRMLRSYSDPCSSSSSNCSKESNFRGKSYEETYDSIKKLPSSLQRQDQNQTPPTRKGIHHLQRSKSKSNRKTSTNSLARAPSLPTSLEAEDFQDEEIEFSMGKLIRQASLNYSDTLPPRKHAAKGVTAHSSVSRQKSMKKLEIESMKLEEIRPQRSTHQLKTQKSLKELESEELQGFKDLGFEFEKMDLAPSVVSIIPGLQEKKRIEEDGKERRTTRPYLSEVWAAQSSAPPVPRWGGKRSTEDMKAQIKFWARAVASNVRQEC